MYQRGKVVSGSGVLNEETISVVGKGNTQETDESIQQERISSSSANEAEHAMVRNQW